MHSLINLWHDTGLYQMAPGQLAMIIIGCLLLFLAIHPKFQFEPLLLLPIAVGTIFVNIPRRRLLRRPGDRCPRSCGVSRRSAVLHLSRRD